eukprot:552461-Amphidinium_carterae.1
MCSDGASVKHKWGRYALLGGTGGGGGGTARRWVESGLGKSTAGACNSGTSVVWRQTVTFPTTLSAKTNSQRNQNSSLLWLARLKGDQLRASHKIR